MEIKTMKISEP